MRAKKQFFYIVLGMSLFIIFFLKTDDASASPTTLHPFDSNLVPSGIAGDKLLDPYDLKTTTVFRPLTYDDGNNKGNNNLFINKDKNSISPINNGFSSSPINHGGSYISLWGKSAKAGVLWSNDAYKMDLDKDQYFSFWIWGGDTDTTSNYSTGGLTFSIQNDPRQQNAYSYDNVSGTLNSNDSIKLAPDETFGMYAADDNAPHLGNVVQNSWSLNLDNRINSSGQINDSFDKGVYQGVPTTGQIYISTSYPGDSSSYLPTTTSIGTTAYTLARNQVDISNISYANGVGMWHHLRLLYQAPKDDGDKGTMTYWFNDIYEDGSSNTNSGTDSVDTQANPRRIERTVSIDLNKLDLTKNADGKRLARWGITYRVDSSKGSSDMVIENASPVMNVSVDPEVIDVTQDNRVLTEDNDYVNSGDKLIFRNTLSYNRGVTDWTNISAVVGVPTGTNLNTTDYGSVTYGKTSPTTVAINKPTVSDNYLQYKLTKGIAASDTATTASKAVVDVNMTAQAADNTEIKVPGISSYFNGDYYIGRTTSKSFIIRGKQVKDLQLSSTTSDPIKAFPSGNVEINGSLKYKDKSTFVNPGAEVYLSINNQTAKQINVPIKNIGDTELDISDAISKELTSELQNDQLNTGNNTLTIYARDSLGNKSNTLTFTIDVVNKSAVLQLNTEGYSFKNINAFYKGLVGRKGDWKVNVNSVNTNWNLTASASLLTQENSFDKTIDTFNGNIVYKSNQNIEAMGEPIEIARSDGDSETGTTIIGQNWLPSEGILLQSNGKTKQGGKYKGTINWDLVQGP
ncbi:hypothetical protein C5L30_001952 [Companilactobacillus farciminis]|uniref:WxL domain-containing protein n=1 Tax=Companilactobacillus farciminis TaxID=1612 RepID=A0A4R5NBJ3_9LACO|nr:hypothetical protein [Companilactobacillus farciminis]ATO45470.1 hypothetical protein LF20184_01275 [Companilactobacillus farciminis KCTC 3681 = DSM 20184]TDG69819.1 hypothetical protein C5L30_001952 [Companilactobacillus farciminis]